MNRPSGKFGGASQGEINEISVPRRSSLTRSRPDLSSPKVAVNVKLPPINSKEDGGAFSDDPSQSKYGVFVKEKRDKGTEPMLDLRSIVDTVKRGYSDLEGARKSFPEPSSDTRRTTGDFGRRKPPLTTATSAPTQRREISPSKSMQQQKRQTNTSIPKHHQTGHAILTGLVQSADVFDDLSSEDDMEGEDQYTISSYLVRLLHEPPKVEKVAPTSSIPEKARKDSDESGRWWMNEVQKSTQDSFLGALRPSFVPLVPTKDTGIGGDTNTGAAVGSTTFMTAMGGGGGSNSPPVPLLPLPSQPQYIPERDRPSDRSDAATVATAPTTQQGGGMGDTYGPFVSPGLQPTRIPKEFHLYAYSPLSGAFPQAEAEFNHEKKMWQRRIFPSADPSGRMEVLFLARTLDDIFAPNANRFSPKIEYDEDSLLDQSLEQRFIEPLEFTDMAFNEIQRQVQMQCEERGLLLERVRSSYMELLASAITVMRGCRHSMISMRKRADRKRVARQRKLIAMTPDLVTELPPHLSTPPLQSQVFQPLLSDRPVLLSDRPSMPADSHRSVESVSDGVIAALTMEVAALKEKLQIMTRDFGVLQLEYDLMKATSAGSAQRELDQRANLVFKVQDSEKLRQQYLQAIARMEQRGIIEGNLSLQPTAPSSSQSTREHTITAGTTLTGPLDTAPTQDISVQCELMGGAQERAKQQQTAAAEAMRKINAPKTLISSLKRTSEMTRKLVQLEMGVSAIIAEGSKKFESPTSSSKIPSTDELVNATKLLTEMEQMLDQQEEALRNESKPSSAASPSDQIAVSQQQQQSSTRKGSLNGSFKSAVAPTKSLTATSSSSSTQTPSKAVATKDTKKRIVILSSIDDALLNHARLFGTSGDLPTSDATKRLQASSRLSMGANDAESGDSVDGGATRVRFSVDQSQSQSPKDWVELECEIEGSKVVTRRVPKDLVQTRNLNLIIEWLETHPEPVVVSVEDTDYEAIISDLCKVVDTVNKRLESYVLAHQKKSAMLAFEKSAQTEITAFGEKSEDAQELLSGSRRSILGSRSPSSMFQSPDGGDGESMDDGPYGSGSGKFRGSRRGRKGTGLNGSGEFGEEGSDGSRSSSRLSQNDPSKPSGSRKITGSNGGEDTDGLDPTGPSSPLSKTGASSKNNKILGGRNTFGSEGSDVDDDSVGDSASVISGISRGSKRSDASSSTRGGRGSSTFKKSSRSIEGAKNLEGSTLTEDSDEDGGVGSTAGGGSGGNGAGASGRARSSSLSKKKTAILTPSTNGRSSRASKSGGAGGGGSSNVAFSDGGNQRGGVLGLGASGGTPSKDRPDTTGTNFTSRPSTTTTTLLGPDLPLEAEQPTGTWAENEELANMSHPAFRFAASTLETRPDGTVVRHIQVQTDMTLLVELITALYGGTLPAPLPDLENQGDAISSIALSRHPVSRQRDAASVIQRTFRKHQKTKSRESARDAIHRGLFDNDRTPLFQPRNERLAMVLATYRNAKPKTLLWLLRLAGNVRVNKILKDAIDDRENQPRCSLPDFIFTYFKQMFGTAKLCEEYAGSLVATLQAFRLTDLRVEIIARFLAEEWPLAVLDGCLFADKLLGEIHLGPDFGRGIMDDGPKPVYCSLARCVYITPVAIQVHLGKGVVPDDQVTEVIKRVVERSIELDRDEYAKLVLRRPNTKNFKMTNLSKINLATIDFASVVKGTVYLYPPGSQARPQGGGAPMGQWTKVMADGRGAGSNKRAGSPDEHNRPAMPPGTVAISLTSVDDLMKRKVPRTEFLALLCEIFDLYWWSSDRYVHLHSPSRPETTFSLASYLEQQEDSFPLPSSSHSPPNAPGPNSPKTVSPKHPAPTTTGSKLTTTIPTVPPDIIGISPRIRQQPSMPPVAAPEAPHPHPPQANGMRFTPPMRSNSLNMAAPPRTAGEFSTASAPGPWKKEGS